MPNTSCHNKGGEAHNASQDRYPLSFKVVFPSKEKIKASYDSKKNCQHMTQDLS